MIVPCWCRALEHSELATHYISTGCEYARRVLRQRVTKNMTMRAARIVVDAAMYGIGCIEGKMREEIEHKKSVDKSA